MNIVAIIQARMASARLPGKILTKIEGKTMLEHTTERTALSKYISTVVVATTNTTRDNATAQECNRIGVQCLRGSEEDVLDRYYQAAKQINADVIVRITADCPLIEAEIIDGLITEFIDSKPDYASNIIDRTYPRGLDTEVISMGCLERIWNEATQKHEREHVTPYILDNPDKFTVLSVKGGQDLSHFRWTVDTPEDLLLVQSIYSSLNKKDGFTWKDVIHLLENNAEMYKINVHVKQKSLIRSFS